MRDHLNELAIRAAMRAHLFGYCLPEQHQLAVHLLGNAVCPPVAADLIEAIRGSV